MQNEQEIIEYIEKSQHKSMLKFLTCGSVDDGKSTLIGRVLFDTKNIFSDQLSSLSTKNEEAIEFAYLVDGLESEREQGITIDVAYRYFDSEAKKYIIADTPGHEQYTKNMATAASNCDLAIILIDATKGLLNQSRRHSYIVALMGIKHILVAVNKMDLVGFNKAIFEKIKSDYLNFFKELKNSKNIDIDFIPISALHGDNVAKKSSNMSWFKEGSLVQFLDTLNIKKDKSLKEFRLQVQYVNRLKSDFRGFSGNVVSGELKEGDKVVVLPQNIEANIKSIAPPSASEGEHKSAVAKKGESTTLVLDKEIDISRGDYIVSVKNSLKVGDFFRCFVVWFDKEPLELNKDYIIKRGTRSIEGCFREIFNKKDMDSFIDIKSNKVDSNDIAELSLELKEKIAFDFYKNDRLSGNFIAINRHTNVTVCAGFIEDIAQSIDKKSKKSYTQGEIELNRFIRENYPEWGCVDINTILK